jgi:predicted MFS family arabinose efflux permease
VLFVNVPIGAALVVLARVMLPETPRQSGKFDITGAITSTLGMTALVYGFVHAATAGWGDPLTVGAFGGGVILLAGFVITEIRASAPITPLKLFADRNRSVSYVARLLMVGAMFGMFFYLTQFLQDILGYSALMTGLGFLPLTAALFFASQLSARVLVERFPVRWLISGGVLMSVLGLTWLTQLSASSNYLDILGPLLIFGLGNGIALVPLTSVALSGVAAKDAGAASGLINVMQQVGGSLGLAVLVSVASAGTRHAAAHPKLGTTLAQQHDAAFIVGAQHAFVASVLFLIATLVLVVTVLRDRPRTGAMPVPAMVE